MILTATVYTCAYAYQTNQQDQSWEKSTCHSQRCQHSLIYFSHSKLPSITIFKMYIPLFVIIVVCSSVQVMSSSTLPASEVRMKYGVQALKALERLLQFFEVDAKDLNLDGVYGLRIAQGQVNALHDMLTSPRNENGPLTDHHHDIRALSDRIDRIANQSLTEIAHQATSYLQRFILVASKPFVIDYEVRTVQASLIEQGERISAFDEYTSDACFAELLGSTDRPNATQCFVTQSCWSMMTSARSMNYRLTHQLLWFLVAKSIGCIDHRPVSSQANRNFKSLEDRYCTNIYQDAQINFENSESQDLFLEEVALCAIIGYEEFLRLDWFQTILSWQDSEYGCFSSASEWTVKSKRHLLVEQDMAHGCLSHKSGLASAVLAAYARAFLQ